MAESRGRLGRQELRGVVHAAFGARELVSVQRLTGGSKKGVYRLALDNGTTSITYVWHADEDYWPNSARTDPSDPFGAASGLGLFEAAHAALGEIGVRVPEVVMLDDSKRLLAGDVAVVEDVRGGTLDVLCAQDPHRARPVLSQLSDAIRTMHRTRRDRYGRPRADRPDDAERAEHIVLRRALADLAEAAGRVEALAAVEPRLVDLLRQRHDAVCARAEYGLIHGELGADHVLVDEHDRPVLIDIEGLMFFDIEWEHVFLELRFGDNYRYLRGEDLDDDRVRFYRLAMYLSLVAGPLRLLDGDFPQRAAMLDIATQNVARTLAQLS